MILSSITCMEKITFYPYFSNKHHATLSNVDMTQFLLESNDLLRSYVWFYPLIYFSTFLVTLTEYAMYIIYWVCKDMFLWYTDKLHTYIYIYEKLPMVTVNTGLWYLFSQGVVFIIVHFVANYFIQLIVLISRIDVKCSTLHFVIWFWSIHRSFSYLHADGFTDFMVYVFKVLWQ